jgi:tRNA-2-methylthio-N6-dimethylallyladenosine synthase
MLPRTFHIETYGCQMNKLDSHLVADRLRAMGLAQAGGDRDAELVLFVTCSVRQHAEDRVYSNAGKLKHRRRRGDPLLIGILGCMAEKDREEIFRRLPHIDFICGPGQLDRIEDLIRQAAQRRSPATRRAAHEAALSPRRGDQTPGAIDDHLEPFEEGRLTPVGEHPCHAYVRAMRGCDNFCAYCIVPLVRGPEVSRPPSRILAEVGRLARRGVRHVTLLGQSVGSYERDEDNRTWHLADLIREAARTPGLVRLDFVTMHPKTLTTDDVPEAMAESKVVAPYLHIPAQSGSNRVLRAMNRGYTVEEYRERVARARSIVPGLEIASDFIVGFPDETEEDFEATLALIRDLRFSQVFAFKYSVRPGTAAARLSDDVPREVKEDRLRRLLETHHAVAEETGRTLVGRQFDCLVTGRSPKPHLDTTSASPPADGCIQLTSRSPGNRIVLFRAGEELIGQVVPVRITHTSAITLFGELARD